MHRSCICTLNNARRNPVSTINNVDNLLRHCRICLSLNNMCRAYATVHRCNDIIARNYRVSEYAAGRCVQCSPSASSVSVKNSSVLQTGARLQQIYRTRLCKRTRVIGDATSRSLCRRFISQRAYTDLHGGRLSCKRSKFMIRL